MVWLFALIFRSPPSSCSQTCWPRYWGGTGSRLPRKAAALVVPLNPLIQSRVQLLQRAHRVSHLRQEVPLQEGESFSTLPLVRGL
jgi:hypothetical protein